MFVDWFNRVWKRPPNLIADEMAKAQPDQGKIAEWGTSLSGSLDRFERLLHGREHLSERRPISGFAMVRPAR